MKNFQRISFHSKAEAGNSFKTSCFLFILGRLNCFICLLRCRQVFSKHFFFWQIFKLREKHDRFHFHIFQKSIADYAFLLSNYRRTLLMLSRSP